MAMLSDHHPPVLTLQPVHNLREPVFTSASDICSLTVIAISIVLSAE